MKANLKTIFSISLLSLLLTLTPVVVTAHGEEADDHSQVAQSTTTTDDTSEDKPSDPAELKTRLEQRKAELKTRLDAVKLARIKNRCKTSQGKLSSIRGRIKGLETSRSHVYENLLNRLNNLSEKLVDKGVDVATLNEQITQLETLVDTFNTDLGDYKLAVADLAEMDCAADPTAFQASLDAARTARAKVAEDAKAIRTLLTDTIKPMLSDLRAQIEKPTETGENE